MAKGNTFINDYLKLLFQGTAIANIADNAASAPLTNLYLALHTADPTASGTQTSSEAAYTGYARVALARNSGGYTVSSQTMTLTALTSFPAATGGSETETFFSIGTTASGSGATVTFTQSGGAINAVTTVPPAGGTGYPISATIDLQVTSGGGTGGIVSATTNSSGVVTSYNATQRAAGTGYSNTSGATTSTGTSKILYSGSISPTIVVANGVTPQLTSATSVVES